MYRGADIGVLLASAGVDGVVVCIAQKAADIRSFQSVKAGQNIGTVFSDPDDSNRTTLHFEIRNERQKLNPSQWVR